MSSGLSVRVERVQSDLVKALGLVFMRSNLTYVHIKRINMTKDLKIARVYVQSLDASITDGELINILTSRMGVLKRSLRKHINLKYFPSIKFLQDDHGERVRGVEAIFDKIRDENAREDIQVDNELG